VLAVLGHEAFMTATGDLGRGSTRRAIELWQALDDPAHEIHAQVELARAAEAGGLSAEAIAALRRAGDLGEGITDGAAKAESLLAPELQRVKLVEEVASGDWGIAGKPLSTEDVRALARGAAVG
jgi:hypothetical protein